MEGTRDQGKAIGTSSISRTDRAGCKLSFPFLLPRPHSNMGWVKGAKQRYSEPSVVFVAFISVTKKVCLHERH